MFVEARTRPVLAEVCQRLGYDNTGAILLRHHTNAVYLVGDVVIKIAPVEFGVERLRVVVAVVDWLTTNGFPTVKLHSSVEQPLLVGAHAITVWQRLDPSHDRPVSAAELGMLLRRLHNLAVPPIDLPTLRPIESVRRSIFESSILSDGERDLLLKRLEALAATWSQMAFPFTSSLIQSDPQTRNALRRFDGTPVLADWDGVALGPREWDVATVAVHCRRFAHRGSNAFADFVAAYGWDPASWCHFEALCRLRELQMIATNARKSRAGTEAAAEVHRRIAGLRMQGEDLLQWHIL